MASNSEKREAFIRSIKVNPSGNQKSNAAKKAQISSNNSSSSNKGSDPARQRSVAQGRGNER